MRILKILLLVIPLAYGAAYGYLWYEVNSQADNAVKMAAPFAEISYDSVHVSLIGDEVGIDNVVIKPMMNQDEFRIETLRLGVPHVGYFISAGSRIKNGEMPEKLGMNIGRIHLDLNSEIFSMLEQMPRQETTGDASGMMLLSNLDALGCGDIKSFTLKEYRQMGMSTMIVDVGANFGFDEMRNMAHVSLDVSAEGLYSIGFNAEIETGPEMSSAMSYKGIPRSTIRYRDNGYYKLRNAYCAGMNDSTAEDYVLRHLQSVDGVLGVKLPEEAVAAYKRFMLKGGTMDITIAPSSRVDPNSLHLYPLEDRINMLGLDIALNGKSLKLAQMKWDGSIPEAAAKKPAETADATNTPRSEVSKQQTKPEIKPVPSKSIANTLQSIRVTDVGKHIEKMLEVTTVDGKVRKGLLEKVTDKRIYLVIKLSAGALSYPVEIDHINKLRVIK